MRKFETAPAPHIIGADPVPRVMRDVVIGMVPAIAVYVWFFGAGLIVNIAIAALVALGSEAAILRLRERDTGLYLRDFSAVVTAVLLAFALPPIVPWYVTAIAAASAIILAKHLYGGLGFNPFNPAMAGYVIVLIAFPVPLADNWLSPRGMGETLSFGQSLGAIFTGAGPEVSWDAVTSATPLDRVQSDLAQAMTMSEIQAEPMMTGAARDAWTWINLAVLAGGIWLLMRGVIRWHIPVSILLTLAALATLFNLIDGDRYPSAFFHLTTGASMMCAFFIATDPVSASTTRKGRLIYGAGIGLLVYVIRTWGAYPDGVGFAVLLMNLAVPAIDYFTVPRAYGHRDE